MKDPPPKSYFGLVPFCKTKSSWKFNHGNIAHEEIVNFYILIETSSFRGQDLPLPLKIGKYII